MVTKKEIIKITRKLLKKKGLNPDDYCIDCKFVRPKTLAFYNYVNQSIIVNRFNSLLNKRKVITDHIKHEIAHVLQYRYISEHPGSIEVYKEPHGYIWQKFAKEMGVEPSPYYEIKKTSFAYKIFYYIRFNILKLLFIFVYTILMFWNKI